MMEFPILIFATTALSLALAEHIPVHHPRDLRPRYANETHPPYPISSGSTAAPLGTSSGGFVPYSYAPRGLSTSWTAIGTITSYDSTLPHSAPHSTGSPSLPTVDPVSSNASMNSTRQILTIFRTSRRTHTITDTVGASSSSAGPVESTSTDPYYPMSNSSSATVSPTASGSVTTTFSPEQTATIESSLCVTPLGGTYCFNLPSSTPSSSLRSVSSYVNGSSTAPASSYFTSYSDSSTPSTTTETPVALALNSTSRASGNTSSSGWFSSIIPTTDGSATFTGGASSTPGYPMWPNTTSSNATESLVSSSVSSSTSISSTSAAVTIISIIPATSDSPVQSTASGSATGGGLVDTIRLPSATLSTNSSSALPSWTIQPSNATPATSVAPTASTIASSESSALPSSLLATSGNSTAVTPIASESSSRISLIRQIYYPSSVSSTANGSSATIDPTISEMSSSASTSLSTFSTPCCSGNFSSIPTSGGVTIGFVNFTTMPVASSTLTDATELTFSDTSTFTSYSSLGYGGQPQATPSGPMSSSTYSSIEFSSDTSSTNSASANSTTGSGSIPSVSSIISTLKAPASSSSTFSPFNPTISLSTSSSIGTLASPSSTNGIPWTSSNAPESSTSSLASSITFIVPSSTYMPDTLTSAFYMNSTLVTGKTSDSPVDSTATLSSLSTRAISSYQTLTTSSLFTSLTSTTSSTSTGTNETSSSTSSATTFQTLTSFSSITASSTSSERDPVYPTYGYGSANNPAGKEQEKGGAQKWPFSWPKLGEW